MALTFGGAVSDRVTIASHASHEGLTAFTTIQWVFPTTITSLRAFWRSAGSVKDLNWEGAGGALKANVNRATTSAIAISSTTLTINKWWCVAMTYSEANGCKIYFGDLATLMAEMSYASNDVGSGASSSDAGDKKIGNNPGDNRAFQGRIATFKLIAAELSLSELQRQQFRSHPTANDRILMQLGFNGTSTQADWSGTGNVGTVTGATVADHAPLGEVFSVNRRKFFYTSASSLLLPTISSGAVLNAPTLAYAITLPTIASTAAVNAPTLAYQVELPTIASSAVVNAPTLAYQIELPTIASTVALNAPTVALDGVLSLPTISSTVTLNAPTLAYAVTLPTISSGVVVNAPTLAYVVELPTIASSAQLFAMTVATTGAQAVTLPTIASGVIVRAPTIDTSIPGSLDIYRVPAENRVYLIPGEDRVYLVPPSEGA